jgi:putative DNA primase/helicase
MKEEDIAKKVEERAVALLPPEPEPVLDAAFLKKCLDNSEWGSATLYASKYKGKYLFNTSVEKGVAWMEWSGIIWQPDVYRRSLRSVELCAVEYDQQAIDLAEQIKELDQLLASDPKDKDVRNHLEALVNIRKEFIGRAKTLRTANGMKKVIELAPLTDESMACREDELNRRAELLPCKNCVINLTTGAFEKGDPADRMSRAVDVEYDLNVDQSEWVNFVKEICGSGEMYEFLHRSFGYASTGLSNEQYIWVFIGRGRNGKGVLLGCIGEVLGPFYHQISPAMILEQKIDPPPSATSEHKFALKDKRLVVGSETKRGKAISEDQLKTLTGDDKINCRPNFSHEVNFNPTHTLMLQVNHMPRGMTSDLAMTERLLEIDLPYSYVANIKEAERKYPALKGKFRQRDTTLKKRLLENPSAILAWLVEGARKFLDKDNPGLCIPSQVLENVEARAREQDYMALFIGDCLINSDIPGTRLQMKHVHLALVWWWVNNRGSDERKVPIIQTVGENMRERDYEVGTKGGKTWVYGVAFHHEVAEEIMQFIQSRGKS